MEHPESWMLMINNYLGSAKPGCTIGSATGKTYRAVQKAGIGSLHTHCVACCVGRCAGAH